MKRREFITLVGVAAVMGPSTARAEQAARLPTIGYSGPGRWAPAFEQRLRELGWIAGQTVAIEYRSAEGHTERFTEIATEFVRLKVNVIVTVGGSPTSRQNMRHRSSQLSLSPATRLAAASPQVWHDRAVMRPA
jgi:putative tryptophan/tyrosine transport system substrate-binding protein